MKLGLHILQNPTGSFSFVGSVPSELAYESKDGTPLTSEVITSQLLLPSKFRSIKTKTWLTKADAIKDAQKLGYKVSE